MRTDSDNLAKQALIFLIVIAFFASAYCSEPQGITVFAEGPVIVNPYLNDSPSACSVVSSQYDDPPSSTTTNTTSSLRSLASSAQIGTASTTTTI